jgi:hypothetical protein
MIFCSTLLNSSTTPDSDLTMQIKRLLAESNWIHRLRTPCPHGSQHHGLIHTPLLCHHRVSSNIFLFRELI